MSAFWVIFVMVVLAVAAAVAGWIRAGQQSAALNELHKELADEITRIAQESTADYFTLRPNWAEAPAWAEWAAQDEGGRIFWFQVRPVAARTAWFSDSELVMELDAVNGAAYAMSGPLNQNWRKAIEPRPGKSADVVTDEPPAMPADGWTDNTGECPVPEGTLIDVEYNDGVVSHGVKALVADDSGSGDCEERLATDWYIGGNQFLIKRWRLHQLDAPASVSLKVGGYEAIPTPSSEQVAEVKMHVFSASSDPSDWVTKEDSLSPEPFPFSPSLTVTQAEYDRFQSIEAAARTYHKTGSETARNRLGKALGVKP